MSTDTEREAFESYQAGGWRDCFPPYFAGFQAGRASVAPPDGTRDALLLALAYLRWQAFGECWTPGHDGPRRQLQKPMRCWSPLSQHPLSRERKRHERSVYDGNMQAHKWRRHLFNQ